MRQGDRIAIEGAAQVLRAIMNYANDHPDFARHLLQIPVPGGRPMGTFANDIGATATRYPTAQAQARRNDVA